MKIEKLKEKLLIKYDWFIYRLAFMPIKRICIRYPSTGYFLKLYIDSWVKYHVSAKIKKHAQLFYDELHKNKHGI
jgi:hypothetical protein